MKRALRSAFLLLFCAVLTVSVPAVKAEAVGTTAVVVDGNVIDASGVTILSQNGRLYAPCAFLFGAMGAEVSCSAEKGTVTAVCGDTTVNFCMDSGIMTVKRENRTYDVPTEAAPIRDELTGSIYIPLRYAAQALGYTVGWDGADRIVTLRSIDNLMRTSGATYSVTGRILACKSKFMSDNRSLTGHIALNADVQKGTEGEGASDGASLSGSGSIYGLTGGGNSSFNANMNYTSSGSGLSGGSGEMSGNGEAALTPSGVADLDVIVNGGAGMIYIKSPLFDNILKKNAGAWLSADIDDLFPGIPYKNLSQAASEKDFDNALYDVLRYICLYDKGGETVAALTQINGMLSDQVMKADGNTYTSDSSFKENDMVIASKLSVTFNGDNDAACSENLSVKDIKSGMEITSVLSCNTGNASSEYNFSIAVPSKADLSFNASFTLAKTDKTPLSEPASGSTVLPVESVLKSYITNKIQGDRG